MLEWALRCAVTRRLADAGRGDSDLRAAVAEAQDLVQGGEDLTLAILGADLISAEDHHLLTAWAAELVADLGHRTADKTTRDPSP